MQLRKFFGGQLLVVLFHKLIDIIAIHLQSPDLGQRHSDHGVLSRTPLSHSATLSDQRVFQAEESVLLVTPFHAFPIILRQETMWKRYSGTYVLTPPRLQI
ncbi:hypothetical protein AVEN_117012-1 [Araneus ventricosus]|uniref:Secreted protein n=1 Tax=Araneus ventricosus TaxID=182803 RepID=A0A4Y2PJN1_ARAVE|nr:hypothetical protein AVEN_7591-1 [Araneus ventricosus]GBN52185.1 hypothetical protein AVEN_117012-1 [Araneus ventricosus]